MSQADISFLNDMYHACPYIAGKAVYVARAIYPLINSDDFVDDLELCNSQGVYKTSNESTLGNQIEDNISTNNIAFIKQNPVDATIQLIYSIKNANIIDATLLNLNGQIIHTFKLNTNENQLNIESKKIADGLYILNIDSDNYFTKQLKVSILH